MRALAGMRNAAPMLAPLTATPACLQVLERASKPAMLLTTEALWLPCMLPLLALQHEGQVLVQGAPTSRALGMQTCMPLL